MECFDEGVLACLYEDVLACWDMNNKDNLDVDNLLANPLVYLLGGYLDGQCIIHYGYIKKCFDLIPMSNYFGTMNR